MSTPNAERRPGQDAPLIDGGAGGGRHDAADPGTGLPGGPVTDLGAGGPAEDAGQGDAPSTPPGYPEEVDPADGPLIHREGALPGQTPGI